MVRLHAVFDRSVALERLVVAVVLLLILWGVGSFGIWEPWELSVVDAARTLSEPGRDPSTYIPLSTWIVGAAFHVFGIGEWSGRLPGVVAAWLTCLLAFVLLRRHCSARAAVSVIAVLASTPMFLLDSRLLMGDAIAIFAQTWVGMSAIAVCCAPRTGRSAWTRYALFAIGLAISIRASGVLLGPLPPLLAVAVWLMLPENSTNANPVARWLLPTIAVAFAIGVARSVSLDSPDRSLWLGGGAVGGNPPTFDKAAEVIFHGFAPWSAALPVAAIWTLVPGATRRRDTQSIASVLLLWAAFAFVSWTLFSSRYGTAPFLALVPLAGLVAIWLAEVSSAPIARWPSAVVVALFIGLLTRDYALYPNSPLRGLVVDGLSVPDVYHPAGQWALMFLVAGALLCLTLVSHQEIERPCPQRTARWLRTQWQVGGAQRGWLLLAASLLGICVGFGLMCLMIDLPIASSLVRVGRVLFFVPFVLAGLIFGLPWVRYAYGRLGKARLFPALGGGLAVGAFVVLSFQPTLSQHFSAKPVYETYGELTDRRAEPLVAYKLPATAATYHTSAPIEEIGSEADLIAFLEKSGRGWAVIRADDLPTLNRAYRRKTGEHLYVADARSAHLLLVASKPIAARPNQSFIAAAVVRDAPEVQHAVRASYEDRIELLGYDLDLPGGDSVGAGQRFTVTWHWRAVGKVPSGYQVFVHIDGYGMRLNGDHVPVNGRYPTQLWETGDVILDTQELTVPANYPVGDYAMYVGFFSGSKRLDVKSGPDDGDDRVNAGVLRVR